MNIKKYFQYLQLWTIHYQVAIDVMSYVRELHAGVSRVRDMNHDPGHGFNSRVFELHNIYSVIL